MQDTSMEAAAVAAVHKALDDKFGENIVVMDLRDISSIADYFVIVTGTSQPQLAALAETAEETLKAHGLILSHTEGVSAGN